MEGNLRADPELYRMCILAILGEVPLVFTGKQLPRSAAAVDVLLAVMEIEAWFIAEYSHLEKLGITCEAIKRELDFDPSTDDIEMVENPAVLLNKIYELAGQSYKKKLRQVQGVVKRLDYARLYLGMSDEVPRLGALIRALDLFFSPK